MDFAAEELNMDIGSAWGKEERRAGGVPAGEGRGKGTVRQQEPWAQPRRAPAAPAPRLSTTLPAQHPAPGPAPQFEELE